MAEEAAAAGETNATGQETHAGLAEPRGLRDELVAGQCPAFTSAATVNQSSVIPAFSPWW
ncbi:MAG: hypothetical protein E6J75_10430 [Deltaproteobacteria bacterium]|nr:MAG: hypothetical protein E6J75_10430 [Deltaproteobacteria bacterium]